jgi:hypothetical protein
MKVNQQVIVSMTVVIMLLSNQEVFAQKAINKLFDEAKKSETSFAVTVPRCLAKLALKKVLLNNLDEEQMTVFLPIVKDLKKVRILIDKKQKVLDPKVLNEFYKNAESDNLQPYAKFTSKGDRVALYAIEEGEYIKDIFVMALGNSERVFVHIKSKIPINVFSSKINQLNK